MADLSRPPPGKSLDLPTRRHIRSFVRRGGRLTVAQRRALETLWPRYGLPPEQILLPWKTFPKPAPIILEIGFGNGESLLQTAVRFPRFNYLGIEVHHPGVGHLLLGIAEHRLDNIRLYCADAVDILQSCLPERSLDRVNIFFPDPWPKKRHHKRRLIQPSFIVLLASRLKAGGILHLATDWADYAQHMQAVIGACPAFRATDPDLLVPSRPPSKYERRGRQAGHPVQDLAYRTI